MTISNQDSLTTFKVATCHKRAKSTKTQNNHQGKMGVTPTRMNSKSSSQKKSFSTLL